MKKIVKLIALNPENVHNTSTYLLKAYAEKNEIIRKECDIKLQFFNSIYPMQSNAEEIYLQQIVENNPEIIGFSTYCWNIEIILRLIRKLKKILPMSLIFLGGPEATGRKEELLYAYSEIDCVLAGEGEIAFQKFLLFVLDKISIANVPNLIWKDNNKLIENPHESVATLDDIPMIFSGGVANPNDIGHSLYSFETKRGCEYKCTYCLHHKGFHEIREFSLEYVFSELQVLLKSDLKYIWIINPCFNENEKRSIQILDYIDKYNYKNIEFGFEIRNETMSQEFIKKVCSMKCIRFIAIGLQTLSKKTLRAINRESDMEKFNRNIELLRKYSDTLVIHVDLIYGLPFQTLEDYKQSIDYVLEMGCQIFFQPLKVLPGTELAAQTKVYGIKYDTNPPYSVLETNDFSFNDMHNALLINGVLNIFQCDSQIRKGMEKIKKEEGVSYSKLFFQIGKYLWGNGHKEYFSNYYKMTLSKIETDLVDAVFAIYNRKFPVNNYNSKYVQLDWGSIAMQIVMP